jgi:2-aminoethylphosphonate-pyruvate transaminase
MPLDTAVILAAGLGSRLKEHGKLQPKGFLRLGALPIIEESIARLRASGVTRIVIVTGHQREFYEALRERNAGLIETVHNPEYAESGSMYSLYCARERIDGDFLLLESDLIYERRALDVLLTDSRDNAVLLSGRTDAGDEVYVEAAGDTIRAMSKDKSQLGADIAGELVGITKVSHALFVRMIADAERLFATTRHVAYETDCLVNVAQHYPVYYRLVPDLLWSEIDDAAHLERARTSIYPAIIRSDSPQRE